MAEDAYSLKQGNIPLLISIPHLGRLIPPDVRGQLTDVADVVADTDWHLDRLYAFAESLGASLLTARYSRYVIDLNRPPDGVSLYPGQTTTGLCPTETFRGEPLYRDGQAPDAAEVDRRRSHFWQPYHTQLQAEIDRLRQTYDNVLLWEAHSIASVLPRLFDGKLPDFNLGTNSGKSCAPALLDEITGTLQGRPTPSFTWVVNDRFKGGYITRQYGRPLEGVHAVQLEMCQSTYMEEQPPFDYRPDLAASVTPAVHDMIDAALGWLAQANR